MDYIISKDIICNKNGLFIRNEKMKEIKKGASNNRIGEEKNNYQGCLMRIIQYDNSNSIIVEFQDKCKYKKKSSYNNFIKGEIKNPYYRVGETNITKEGYLIEIIDCDVSNANNITNRI